MIFIDSSALIAVMDRSDSLHPSASTWLARHGGKDKLCTTDFVLDEVLTHLARRAGVQVAQRAASLLLADKELEKFFVDPPLFEAGVKEMNRHRDKHLSFTDCVSFATMRLHAITVAFAFDGDFTRCGFECVP